jgi:anhydro-N-acetylmuramic acid kinase
MDVREHPLTRLWARLARHEACVAGVLSGTSADGIDVALLRFGASGAPVPLAFATLPFAPELARELRAVLDGAPRGPRELALLTRDLGRAFGNATRAVAEREHLALDLVGSHGQTVYHHDGREPSGPATLQLGDGDFVAATAGALTASDFRMADLAAGGEGAPLSGLLDSVLFPALPRPAAILNLGGMGNVTLLSPAGGPLAFDTGPANALLDGLARELLGRAFDEDGRAARRGRADRRLVDELLAHPFFARRPPKSTGRDTFGAPFVARFIERGRALDLGAEDLLASATLLVAESVARALADFARPRPERLVLCGGGAFNLALADELARRTGLPCESSARHGVPPEAREAIFFAHLAVRCALGLPSTEPSATGARRGGVLGKLSVPPDEAALEPAIAADRPVPRSQAAERG